MSTDSLVLAIIGHWVGDYLLQNDWMALNKKKQDVPCLVHCALWATAVCLFAGWPVCVGMLLLMLHFAQDRTNLVMWWMTRVNSQRRFSEPDRLEWGYDDRGNMVQKLVVGLGPWSIIVVDNVWHIVTLWAVWRFVV